MRGTARRFPRPPRQVFLTAKAGEKGGEMEDIRKSLINAYTVALLCFR